MCVCLSGDFFLSSAGTAVTRIVARAVSHSTKHFDRRLACVLVIDYFF